MRIIAIDPGSKESGFCIIREEDKTPLKFGKEKNYELLEMLRRRPAGCRRAVIERVECYGMGVGRTVFETCVWTGRFLQTCENAGIRAFLVPRRAVKLHLCGRASARDANIVGALKERFGEKGTKNNPGFFFGFKADVWQAYALGLTFLEMEGEN